jgi:hypothetical protein
MMRALSSADHYRRRPVPVISSIRRTVVTAPIGVVGRLAFKRMLKSIPHSPVSSHNPSQAKTWSRSTAYHKG